METELGFASGADASVSNTQDSTDSLPSDIRDSIISPVEGPPRQRANDPPEPTAGPSNPVEHHAPTTGSDDWFQTVAASLAHVIDDEEDHADNEGDGDNSPYVRRLEEYVERARARIDELNSRQRPSTQVGTVTGNLGILEMRLERARAQLARSQTLATRGNRPGESAGIRPPPSTPQNEPVDDGALPSTSAANAYYDGGSTSQPRPVAPVAVMSPLEIAERGTKRNRALAQKSPTPKSKSKAPRRLTYTESDDDDD
ncbi:hypothetical protein AAE478_009838 [Parahypoxylon ruwenzoriense]